MGELSFQEDCQQRTTTDIDSNFEIPMIVSEVSTKLTENGYVKSKVYKRVMQTLSNLSIRTQKPFI